MVARSSPPETNAGQEPRRAGGTQVREADRGELVARHDGARVRLDPVRGRATFAALRRSGRRARSGPVGVHYEPALPADQSRRVAYSVPRRVGRATERNRCRRRLREVAREVVPQVPPGAYLIGVEPGVRNVSFQELRRRVTEAMQRASGVGEP